MQFTRNKTNYDKYPQVALASRDEVILGWQHICKTLCNKLDALKSNTGKVITIDCYHGVYENLIYEEIQKNIKDINIFFTNTLLKDEQEILDLIQNDLTEDRIFGYMTRLHLEDFFDSSKIHEFQKKLSSLNGCICILGIGAHYIAPEAHVKVYADMPRWEIQTRQRKNEINNIGVNNKDLEPLRTYKHSFFIDWRVLDRYKKSTWESWDFILDTTIKDTPKMISASVYFNCLQKIIAQPFRLVPFFDPGVWGGQWMKEKFSLNSNAENYAWGFDCVPEENSIYLGFDDILFETPSINLVFKHPIELLGEPVHARFGDEFPIRFDLLDTVHGQNLSYQVHPLTEYIQEHFGMHYTQDESYYILEAMEDAVVYLGLKEQADIESLMNDLERSKRTGKFPDDKYAEKFKAHKHDHFLIPAGTVHCSGKNTVVLEISATPYIFTFKLWDWGRLGLDGLPRPINTEHGKHNIVKNRNTPWVKENLINKIIEVDKGDGWREEKTGLHEREFIETRRHWFSKKVLHNTGGVHGSVNVLNLVQGDEIIVESPTNNFKPFTVHYAETFIIPAIIGAYSIRPYGNSEGKECATIKAFVRH